jgi:predicted ABC-type ATPase
MRKVATPGGSRYYGLPIGAPITADAIAKARARNGGKRPPAGSTAPAGAVRGAPVKRVAQQREAAAAAQAARKVSPTITFTPPSEKASGTKVKAGSAVFGVPKNSRTFKKDGSLVSYNVDSAGNLRVLTPNGEANLTPEAEARVKALMVAERESLTETTPDAAPKPEEPATDAAPAKPRSRFARTNEDGTPKETPASPKVDSAKQDAEREERRRKSAAQEAESRRTGVFNEYDPSKRAAEGGSDVETTPLTELGYDRDEEVTIYRGVPADAEGGINEGDWVTPDEQLAKDYAGTGRVESKVVKAQDLRTDPEDDSMSEMVYVPESSSAGAGESDDAEALDMSTSGLFQGRIEDSLGESVAPAEDDLADMRRSPLTSQHMTPEGEFTPERKALHDQIIARFFDGVEAVDNPVQFMNGGGPASGKGTMTRGDNAKITGYPATHIVDDFGNFKPVENPGGVIVDPDQLKLSLPEGKKAVTDFANGVERDEAHTEWAANLHGESSYLAQRLVAAAHERGVNLILDGVNDGSAESVKRKVEKARSRGYKVEANYIYLDPEEALARARSRAERAGRRVPEKIVIGAYSKLPGIFDAIKEGLFDKVRLFDNNVEGSNAYLVGEGSLDGSFDFKQPDYAEVYQRYLDSQKVAEGLLGLTQKSDADRALKKNLKDLAGK